MADADLSARQQAEGHKTLLLLETEFNAKPRTTVLSIQGTQIRALAQFPSLFQTYPYPMILNAAILKLADWFHHGNNVVRMHIYKVLEGVSKDHFTKIINVDETMRRIIPVLGSNDPTARALTLRVLGCMAIIFKDSLDVQHGLLQGIQKSTDRFETEAAVWACDQFCARSTTFLSVMFIRIQSKLADPTTSFDIQLKLIKILRHMHSDIVMSRQAKQLCLKLLEQQNSNERLVIVVLRTLTKLLSVALIDQQEQVVI
ncbi:uncharacterized protein BX664DRAFT_366039 [Halteromyces radiatus]|uniref:uncharacterized protein n=1 Tax=Halteromyces radiatus TaxID=101107 RepID=UPI00221E4CAC|nr:uncharacterized protein BX664DRAFT_366039 [Halteromyces radiatus]KAI8086512.1 hypothetical protein BX664DRAFT_366039 [Halteromyces radiatus]